MFLAGDQWRTCNVGGWVFGLAFLEETGKMVPGCTVVPYGSLN